MGIVALTPSQNLAGFKRCSVCKIDLKGRFVFVDEGVEQLLGCSQEELFGRSFLDFLDQRSQQLVSSLLNNRNHYETFYDSTTLTLIDSNNHKIVASVVASLNFAAGNPVNFQLIIHYMEAGDEIVIADTDRADDRAFIRYLANNSGADQWRSLLGALIEYADCNHIAVYIINGDQLEPRSCITKGFDNDYTFEQIPNLKPLHTALVKHEREFDFTHEADIQFAVENGGKAINELILVQELESGQKYFVRFIYPEKADQALLRESITRARLGLAAGTKMISSAQASADSGNFDIQFTIGFLDSLGIGGLLIQSDGQVIGYNNSFRAMVGVSELEGQYLDVMTLFAECNGAELLKTIENHFACEITSDDIDDLVVDIKLPDESPARMVIVRFAYEANDCSGVLVLIPTTAGADFGRPTNDINYWNQTLGSLKEEVDEIVKEADRFGHSYYNKLGREGNADLSQFRKLVRRTIKTIAEAESVCKLISEPENKATVDLNLLVSEITESALKDNIEIDIEAAIGNLPKIQTDQAIAEKLLADLIGFDSARSTSKKTRLKLSADSSENEIKLTLAGTGKPSSKQDSNAAIPASLVRLAESLGWQIDQITDDSSSDKYHLTIPRQA